MIVSKTLGMSLRAGGMTELNLREFPCSPDHEILMAERVGKNDVASAVNQILGGLVAGRALVDAGRDDGNVLVTRFVKSRRRSWRR